MYFYEQYFTTADKTALDSALVYIEEEMKENPKENWSLYCYKLSIYSIKEEYDKALSSCFNDTIVIDERFPFYQEIIKERFQAMKAQSLNDYEERNCYLKEIMQTIGNYMKQNGLEMANLLDKQKTKVLVCEVPETGRAEAVGDGARRKAQGIHFGRGVIEEAWP